MYLGFIIYISVIATVFCFIKFPKFRLYVAAVILMAIFIFGCCALQNAARAEDEEVRTAFIVSFDLANNCFILEDEDGYLWAFKLENNNYTLGNEYILHLPIDSDPWYEEV